MLLLVEQSTFRQYPEILRCNSSNFLAIYFWTGGPREAVGSLTAYKPDCSWLPNDRIELANGGRRNANER